MKTIIQIVQHLHAGGIETMALELARFAQPEYHTMIVSLEGNRQDAIAKWPRLEPYADHLIFLDKADGWSVATLFSLIGVFRQYRPAAVHTHHIGPMLYGGIAARLAGISRIIHTEHDAWHLQNTRRRKLQGVIMKLVRPIMVADAGFVKRALLRYFRNANVRIILNGTDTEYFKPRERQASRLSLGLPADKILIGTAGRLESVKAQDRLIHALKLLPDHVHLAIAGEGSLRQSLEQLAGKINVADRVHFMGRLDDLRPFYSALDIFSLPSHKEGMPLSVLEAQACGVPSVITDVGGSREALCPDTGILVVNNEINNLVTALRQKLVSLGKTLETPRIFVQKNADMQRVSRMYTDLYETAGSASV